MLAILLAGAILLRSRVQTYRVLTGVICPARGWVRVRIRLLERPKFARFRVVVLAIVLPPPEKVLSVGGAALVDAAAAVAPLFTRTLPVGPVATAGNDAARLVMGLVVHASCLQPDPGRFVIL